MFEPLKPKEYHYLDAPLEPEPDWQKLYIESLEQTMRLAGAFRNILLNPERIESVGDSLGGNLTRLQENLAAQIMSTEIARSKK